MELNEIDLELTIPSPFRLAFLQQSPRSQIAQKLESVTSIVVTLTVLVSNHSPPEAAMRASTSKWAMEQVLNRSRRTA